MNLQVLASLIRKRSNDPSASAQHSKAEPENTKVERKAGLPRRSFLASSLTAGAAVGVGMADAPAFAAEPEKQEMKAGGVILFQGDSITDARRDRRSEVANHPNGLGNGYPFMIASELLRDYPGHDLKIHNRGISGNKVPDLQKRWEKDCLDLKPDVLSILIGVNDIWHKLNGRYEGTVADYENGFTQLLEETQEKLPETRIVICEPFVLRTGAVTDKWFPEFDKRLAAARRVASKMELTRVPFQEMFDEAVKSAPPAVWAADGVHPTLAGHSLMAKTWREVAGV